MILTIIVFLAILATLILVHELGHFLVARRNGVIAEEFGFGFPPRIIGTYKDKSGQRKWVFGNKEITEEIKHREETIYSINWIPLGGFVRIKGEDGADRTDPTSFGAKSIWTRFKILAAGVTMNLILGVVLLTFALWLGLPQQIDDTEQVAGSRVIIGQVMKDTPAQAAGLQMGDEVTRVLVSGQETAISTVGALQEVIRQNANKEMAIEVKHPGDTAVKQIMLTPRANEQGEGQIGVQLARTVVKQHGLVESFTMALKTVVFMVSAIFLFLKDLIVGIFTTKEVQADVAGPVGIAILTGQAVRMGIAYVLNFAALLSINLAVINFLPIPALDGGRVLFLLFEKIKGAPLNQRMEAMVHTVSMVFLLGLMFIVIVADFFNFGIVDKIKGVF